MTATISRNGFADEYPFTSRTLYLDGLKYHYIDEGEGDPILMVHGNPTWSFAWRNLVKNLSPNYRALAVDHIGCGFSDKPQNYQYTLNQHIENLSSFITQLDLTKITLVAHDWGGAIGMGAVCKMKERFSRIILMNTAAFLSQEIPFRIAVCRWPILGSIGVKGFNLFSRAALVMAVNNRKNMTDSVKAGYLAPYNSWKNRIAVDQFVKDIPLDQSHPSYQTLQEVESGLENLKEIPKLFIWGEKDWCFTTNFLDRFQEFFPDSKTHRIPTAGHYLFEDAPEEVSEQIQIFLKENSI